MVLLNSLRRECIGLCGTLDVFVEDRSDALISALLEGLIKN